MERERLQELNKKYGDIPIFQQMLSEYLKGKFKEEVQKERRLRNV